MANNSLEQLKKAFYSLDSDGDRHLGLDDIVTAYQTTYSKDSHSLSENEAKTVIYDISSEKKSISFDDFVIYLNHHNLLNEVLLDADSQNHPSPKNFALLNQRILEVLLSTTRPNIIASGGYPQDEGDVIVHPGRQPVHIQSKSHETSNLWSSRYWFGDADITWLKHLIAGGVAGAVSRTTVSPLERMKILFQIQNTASSSTYSGVFGTLAKIWREEGFKGYMRGNGTNVIRIVPYSAVQFATYEQLKRLLMENGKSELDTKRRLMAGAGAGVASVVATYPLDIVRTRISVQTGKVLENADSLPKDAKGRPVLPKMPGIYKTFVEIYTKEGGLFATFRGLGATLTGVAPYVALNFQCYEVLRKFFTPEGQSAPSGIRKLACGALAGSIAQTFTYPLDVLRRRMQVASMPGMGYGYTSTWDALKKTVKHEGVRGLYKGLIPNYLKVAPAIGVSFWSYELVNDFLRNV